MEYNLFLDDYRQPIDCVGYVHVYGIRPDIYLRDWVIVKNYDEFVSHIENNGLPLLVTFDHDLADTHYCPEEFYDTYDEWAAKQNFKEKTGMDCAKWLIDYCIDNNLKLPEYLCHSMNPWGRKNINSILDNYKKFEGNG